VFSAPPPNEDEGDSENNHNQTTLTTSTTSKRPPLRPYVRRLDEVSISTTDSEGPPRIGSIPRSAASEKPSPYRLSGLISRSKKCRERKYFQPHQPHPYSLDDNLEWVVDAKSRRVCWLPPGYISGIEDGHFFVGSSIVMAGQDGIVRRLTFRNPSSDS
jgi:hypothetical protein